jgi:hypothetical protein
MEEALTSGQAEGGYHTALRRAADTLAERSRASGAAPMPIVHLYLRAGEHDRAFEWLDRAIEARDPNAPYVGLGPTWDGVRGDPRLEASVRRLNLPR